ncbi:hypothetical protein OROHE_010894 [Orobanche hederae]
MEDDYSNGNTTLDTAKADRSIWLWRRHGKKATQCLSYLIWMHAWFGATADTRYSDIKLEDLETSHLVLVRGGGFGAWCWYKTIALLEEGGYKVTAVDLTGVGIHSFDPNSITSLSQYVRPLTDLLENLTDGRKNCNFSGA